MSTLQVEICRVKDVECHPNADKLDIITVKGWTVIASKESLSVGDKVVFIPPDSVLPSLLHEFLGITKYCAELPKDVNGFRPAERRVKAARLRGLPSYGTIMTMRQFVEYFKLIKGDVPSMLPIEGENVANLLGITKWEPPEKITGGDIERDHPHFHKYTNIENWRNHPNLFTSDDVVMILEKIHGGNIRLGLVEQDGQYEFVAGSHNTRRKKPEEGQKDKYWMPYELCPRLKEMMYDLWDQNDKAAIIVFGELYGRGIQDMYYNKPNGLGFLAFDISINGLYMGYEKFKWFKKYEIPHPPILYTGPYDKQKILELTDGPTLLGTDYKFKGREGVVITHALEENDSLVGRKILKSVSVDYLNRKGGTDGH